MAFKSRCGTRFVREMEQGKATLRMDEVLSTRAVQPTLGPVPIQRTKWEKIQHHETRKSICKR